MADNRIMEEIFKTIDIITDHKLYLTEYVYTEDCTIVATTADPFMYRIQHEQQEFEAHSPIGEKFEVGQTVVVLFTDYSKLTKKIIMYSRKQSTTTFGSSVTFDGSTSFNSAATLNGDVTLGSKVYIGSTQTSYSVSVGGTTVPSTDAVYSFGAPAYRWSVVYAQTGSINTSDINQKTEIEPISEIEKRVAIKLKSLIKKYKFKNAVEEKGDLARFHFGVIAQEVESAFEEESLDANAYGLFCKDSWFEKDGKIVDKDEYGAIERIQLGIRYDELFAFIISAL